jgi:hypothetical protein
MGSGTSRHPRAPPGARYGRAACQGHGLRAGASEPHRNGASSEARNATSAAISYGFPIRPKETSLSRSTIVLPARLTPASNIGVCTSPGQTAFTRTWWGA